MVEITAHQAAERIEAAIGALRHQPDMNWRQCIMEPSVIRDDDGKILRCWGVEEERDTNAAYVAACSPGALLALLAERRELLAREVPIVLMPGSVHQTSNYGPVTFLGIDTYMGQSTYHLRTPYGSRYMLPEEFHRMLVPPPSPTATDVSQYSKPDRAPGEDGYRG